MRHFVDSNGNVKVIGLAVVALVLVLVSGAIFVFATRPGALTVTCHLAVSQRCEDTADSIIAFPDMTFYPRLTGHLIAVDVRPAPSEWATSGDPGFATADWAAWLERDDGPPILAACYYSSDRMVACHTQMNPF